jgi:hypothetical protein
MRSRITVIERGRGRRPAGAGNDASAGQGHRREDQQEGSIAGLRRGQRQQIWGREPEVGQRVVHRGDRCDRVRARQTPKLDQPRQDTTRRRNPAPQRTAPAATANGCPPRMRRGRVPLRRPATRPSRPTSATGGHQVLEQRAGSARRPAPSMRSPLRSPRCRPSTGQPPALREGTQTPLPVPQTPTARAPPPNARTVAAPTRPAARRRPTAAFAV